ncbi:glycosyl-4,4'-diaponeurosporenoate acyltransferase CrtO family protein [Arundinibacter roseus]|uniref:Glycosyl-4,4'-diaponeurosporenoate acyltransferase n=1 Tax=Arundinibacter roseus TaxID=2070510 RepID=A0A4R4KJK2_9BACT|nr:hypothetical protein [Arundinibacter roseus]TDB67086.1 hypothetical protein EZE20_08205 [Arundinibacter roseus]
MKREAVNQILNVFWTALASWLLVLYWSRQNSISDLLGISLISIIAGLLPRHFYTATQLSNQKKWYEKAGIKVFRKITQNGEWVYRLSSEKENTKRRVRLKANQQTYLRTIAMYERFHWIFLIFFLVSAGLAIWQRQWQIGLLVFLFNIPYNVYPILLQQYNKLRFKPKA